MALLWYFICCTMIMFPYTISQPELNPGYVSTSKRISVETHIDSSGDITEIAPDTPANTEARTKRKCIGIAKDIVKILTKSGGDKNTYIFQLFKRSKIQAREFLQNIQGLNFRH